MSDEEKRVLLELKERGGAVELKAGDSLCAESVFGELQKKSYIRSERGDLTPDGEGGTIAGKVTVFLTKKRRNRP